MLICYIIVRLYRGAQYESVILKANKDVFNLPAINLTATGTALPSKFFL